MFWIRSISVLFAFLFSIGVQNVRAQDLEASIIIEASPIREATDGVFGVSVSISPKATYESPLGESRSAAGSIPIHISLPWYVDLSRPQCVGNCRGLPRVGPNNTISAAVEDGLQSTAIIVFSMTITDDSYMAAGIVVQAGASRASLYVPITQPAQRQVDTMGEVRVASLLHISEPGEEFVVDIDVSLPLSGGTLVVVPAGLNVEADSGCVDVTTREPSDYGQMCVVNLMSQTNGETWVQVGLPSGNYSMRIYLTPDPDFLNGAIEISASGRYFQTEIVVVNVPRDFQSEPPT